MYTDINICPILHCPTLKKKQQWALKGILKGEQCLKKQKCCELRCSQCGLIGQERTLMSTGACADLKILEGKRHQTLCMQKRAKEVRRTGVVGLVNLIFIRNGEAGFQGKVGRNTELYQKMGGGVGQEHFYKT